MKFSTIRAWLTVLIVLASSPLPAMSQGSPSLLNVEDFITEGDCRTKDGFRTAGEIISLAKTEFDQLEALEKKGLLSEVEIQYLDLLEASLAPIYETGGDPYEKAKEMGPDLMTVVVQVYAVIGQDPITEFAIKQAVQKIESDAKARAKLKKIPESVSLFGELKDILEFSSDQSEAFDKLVADVEENLSKVTSGEFSNQEKMLAEHWDSLLEILDQSQKETVQSFINEPVQWFRRIGRSGFAVRDFESGIHRSIPGPLLRFRTDDGRGIFQLTPTEIRENGIEYVHAHIQMMLKDEFIWGELEFSEEQCERFRMGMPIVSTSGYHKERLEELLSRKAEYPDTINDHLIESQLESLPSIELQYLTSEFESSVGLLHPVMCDFLSLTAGEKKKIKSVAKAYADRRRSQMQQVLSDRKRVLLDFRMEFEGILTAKQKVRFKKMLKHLPSSLQVSNSL